MLQDIGLASLPMTINQKHIADSLNGTYKGTQQEKLDHMFTAKELATLPSKIADPIAIIYDKRSGKANPSVSNVDVIVEMQAASGKNVIAAVQVGGNGHINGLRIDTNKVSTVHGNSDTITRLVDAINDDLAGNVAVFYINNDKTTKVLQSAGNPIPRGLSDLDGSIHSINDPGSPVKMRISSATESQQFKRWFGDWQNHPENASKIVNEDGTPKVMYHGSPNQFTVFDRKKAKSSGMYGKGFYFTNSDTHAEQYGNLYQVYLNIRNPLQSGEVTVTRAQVRSYLEAVAENEDYSIENYGTYDVDKVLDIVMGKNASADAFQVIQDISSTAIGDLVEATELFNDINGTKFDGIVVPTETVAFYPEQIKSATDNIGTFDGSNPDIRYSMSKEGKAQTGEGLQIRGEDVLLQQEADANGLVWENGVPFRKDLLELERKRRNGEIPIAPPIPESAKAQPETAKSQAAENIAPPVPGRETASTVAAETEYREEPTAESWEDGENIGEEGAQVPTTVRERTGAKLAALRTELSENQRHRQELSQDFDEKIAAPKARNCVIFRIDSQKLRCYNESILL